MSGVKLSNMTHRCSVHQRSRRVWYSVYVTWWEAFFGQKNRTHNISCLVLVEDAIKRLSKCIVARPKTHNAWNECKVWSLVYGWQDILLSTSALDIYPWDLLQGHIIPPDTNRAMANCSQDMILQKHAFGKFIDLCICMCCYQHSISFIMFLDQGLI